MKKLTKISKTWIGAALAVAALLCVRPAAAQIGIVSVTGGRVEGVTVDGTTSFKGIPFVAPPVGNLRWRPPQPVRPWPGIRKAEHFAPGCMQPANAVPLLGEPSAMSEDCLYLNVWTPAKFANARLPVVTWIYGGSFLEGMTSQPLYDGTHLAQQGVVVVTLAYRLGVFGFLADPELSAASPRHESGNYGLLDMIAGLKWVRKNIAQFGGDPSRVTVFGESAGAISVGAIVQSPTAKALFRGAIAESGSAVDDLFHEFVPLQEAQPYGQRLLAGLGAMNVSAARALGAQALLKAQGPELVPGRGGFSPWMVIGSHELPAQGYRLYEARRFNDTPVLIGSNSDEGRLFVPPHTTPSQFEGQARTEFGPYAAALLALYPHATEAESSQAAADLLRDSMFAWGAWTWARLQSEYGQGKAYLYYFDRRSPLERLGPTHGAELPFVFGNMVSGAKGSALGPSGTPGPVDVILSGQIQSYWANFAKTGNPNGPGLPHWPAFSASSPRVMYLDAEPHAGPVPNLRKLEVLDRYFAHVRAEAHEAAQDSSSGRPAP